MFKYDKLIVTCTSIETLFFSLTIKKKIMPANYLITNTSKKTNSSYIINAVFKNSKFAELLNTEILRMKIIGELLNLK
jgi:hypothetical protein